MFDLVKYVNGLFFSTTEEDWVEFFDKQLDFRSTIASSIMSEPTEYNRCPFPTLNQNFTSFAALELMARNKNHSVLLVNDEEKLSGILTQSMLISFLRQTKSKWSPEFRTMEVKDFTLETKPKKSLKTVREDEHVINALLRMEDEDVLGLPVVDHEGILTGCISVRDLRGVGHDGAKFFRLYRTVKSFKALCAEEFDRLAPTTHYSNKTVPASAVYVTPEATMEDVMNKMDDGNLHRVFICSTESAARGKPVPIGVISQSDVLYQTLSFLIGMAKKHTLPTGSTAGISTPARMSTRKTSIGRKEDLEMKKASPAKASPTQAAPTKRNIPISFE